jgi:hypothetical protein
MTNGNKDAGIRFRFWFRVSGFGLKSKLETLREALLDNMAGHPLLLRKGFISARAAVAAPRNEESSHESARMAAAIG